MKRIIAMVGMFLCTHSFATVAELSPRFYEPAPQGSVPQRYAWLYEILIDETDRATRPDEAARSFKVHLRDSQRYFPHPDEIAEINLSTRIPYDAFGRITYVGFFAARYHYDLSIDEDGVLQIEVRVHFRPEEKGLVKRMHGKFKRAENIWNSSRIQTTFNYRFNFKIVEDRRDAHFSVELKREFTRGPYFRRWSAAWGSRSIAHEFGHMLGLGDEYHTLSQRMDCLHSSMMCSSRGEVTFQHHYHVLRRTLEGWETNRFRFPSYLWDDLQTK